MSVWDIKDGDVVCPKCGSRNTHDFWSNPDDHGLTIIHNWRCRDCGWDDSKKVMTNGDKIRQMSDEELAGFLTEYRNDYYLETLDWLKEEVKEDE